MDLLARAIAFALRTHREGAKNTKGFAKKFKKSGFLILCVSFASLRLCGGRLSFKCNRPDSLLRVLKLSGSVARHLSGCHSALKGVRDEKDGTATGDPEDEI